MHKGLRTRLGDALLFHSLVTSVRFYAMVYLMETFYTKDRDINLLVITRSIHQTQKDDFTPTTYIA